ncbi:hypothetical protein Dimus_012255 [Dionaea muscipula]
MLICSNFEVKDKLSVKLLLSFCTMYGLHCTHCCASKYTALPRSLSPNSPTPTGPFSTTVLLMLLLLQLLLTHKSHHSSLSSSYTSPHLSLFLFFSSTVPSSPQQWPPSSWICIFSPITHKSKFMFPFFTARIKFVAPLS